MLKGLLKDGKTGETYIVIGLSQLNLDQLKTGRPILPVNLKEFGMHGKLCIFSEVDEQAMVNALKKHFNFLPVDVSTLDG